jgi:hypothetical protein
MEHRNDGVLEVWRDGGMEHWSNGVLEGWNKKEKIGELEYGSIGVMVSGNSLKCFLDFTQYSNTPSLHYSIYFSSLSAASTLSGVIGSSLIRTPTAS